MKIRSLVLGSVAAAGLSTAGYAADLGVLTSLDVCDSLGLSGLTISSDTNCLQISGGVEYEFVWGDYEGPSGVAIPAIPPNPAGTIIVTGPTNNTVVDIASYDDFNIATPGFDGADASRNMDWSSKVKAWVQFVGTAASDFGPASAVIKLQQKSYSIIKNEGGPAAGSTATTNTLVGIGSGNTGVVIDRAYVSVGDTTVLTAGKVGTIMNFGDDVPLNFLGLFNSSKVDTGVKWRKDLIPDGGHGIQITSDLGNGVKIGAALENLDGGKAGTASSTATTYTTAAAATAANVANAGTAVGVISYAGDGIAAHLTVAASGFLDGVVENWGYHAGFSGTFDIVKVVAAIAGDQSGYWNGLASAEATFDIFKLAASVEAVNVVTGVTGTDIGAGLSASAAVTDTVSINLGGRWYRDNSTATPYDSYQVAAQLVAAVTETITLTGEVGLYANNSTGAPAPANLSVYYGAATAEWKPGGGFTTSLKGEAYSNGAYKATFKAAKTFQ